QAITITRKSATGETRASTARARSAPSLPTTIAAATTIAGHKGPAIVPGGSSATNGIPMATSTDNGSNARAAGKQRTSRSARNNHPTPKADKKTSDGRGQSAQSRRPPRRPALPLGHPAGLHAQVPQGDRGAARAVPAGTVDGGLRPCPGRVLRLGSGLVGLYGAEAHRD